MSGTCWWCGAPADSREHKFKRSDLARLSAGEQLYWGGGDRGGKYLQGYKRSDVMRFGRILCQVCNNARSQPFDNAYDKYAEYVAKNLDDLWHQGLQFKRIFGHTWRDDVKNLGRYFAKSFG